MERLYFFRKNDKQRKLLTGLALFAIAFFASLLTANNIWRTGISGTDSSVFLYIGKMITKGYIPYRDSFDHKGPLLYLINAVGYSISPQKGIWLVELGFLFGTVCCIYKIARLCTDNIKSLIVAGICIAQLADWFDGGNLTEEYAMLFIAYSLFVFLDFFQNQKITRARLILTGFSFMAVCFLRANMISVWVVFCLAVLCQCIVQRRFKELGQFLLFFLIGAAVLALPIILWLAFHGAVGDFWESYITFNMMYTGNDGTIKNIIAGMVEFYKYPIVMLAFASGVFVFLKDRRKLDALYVCFLAITMVMMCMSGRTYLHYALILIPTFAYPLARIIESLRMDSIKRCNVALIGAAIMLILLCMGKYAYTMVKCKNYSAYETAILDLSRTIAENTDEGDKIIVNGNADIIYLLSDRDSYSKYSYQSPIGRISGEITESYYRDVKAKGAKIIVLRGDAENYEEMKELTENLGYVKIAGQNMGSNAESDCFYIYKLN